MGMYIFSKAIDCGQVMAAFGSKDKTLFEKVKQTTTYDCYNSQPFDNAILLEEALHHIIYGEPFIAESAHIYGYAFIALCAAQGREVPYTQDLKLGYETELVTSYLATDFGIDGVVVEDYLFEDSPAKELPKRDDFPILGIIPHDRLENLFSKLPDISLTEEELEDLFDEDDDKGCAYEAIIGIRKNLKFCMDSGLDLVSFCH